MTRCLKVGSYFFIASSARDPKINFCLDSVLTIWGIWDADINADAGTLSAAGSDDGTAFTFGVGAEYEFNEQVNSYLQLQRYQLSPGDVSEIRLGVRYHF